MGNRLRGGPMTWLTKLKCWWRCTLTPLEGSGLHEQVPPGPIPPARAKPQKFDKDSNLCQEPREGRPTTIPGRPMRACDHAHYPNSCPYSKSKNECELSDGRCYFRCMCGAPGVRNHKIYGWMCDQCWRAEITRVESKIAALAKEREEGGK